LTRKRVNPHLDKRDAYGPALFIIVDTILINILQRKKNDELSLLFKNVMI